MRCSPARSDRGALSAARGYTLVEILIVVSLITVLAAVALPSLRPAEHEQLDLAASWIAEKVRFARAEALRTASPIYLEINRDTERLLVAQADLTGATVAPGTTLRDPISKEPLDLILSSAPSTAGIDITAWPFNYPNGGAQASVVFDARGLPVRKAGGNYQLMTASDITLTRRGQQRVVRVDRTTGRVTIQ
jgi:prepilin-type N-terminal cleavage/methylation domain-containing protein